MPISNEDLVKIQELRSLVKDKLTPYYDTDFNLLRWLQGHNYNVEMIKPKLENHLFLRKWDWDLDNMADAMRADPIQEHWRNGLTGESGVIPNVIINLEQTGKNDWWGMLATHPMNQILKSRVQDLEIMLARVMELEKKTGEQAHIMYVMDLGGLAWDRKLPGLLTGPLSALSAFMADHYVELIHSFVLVNVPTFISAVWTIAHPLLPERTKKKVVILGGNWKSEILKYANPSVLPSFWNQEGEDGPFKYHLKRCIPYPSEKFYKDQLPSEAETLTIPAGKSDSIDIYIDEDEDLKWEIHSDGTFNFMVYYVEDPRETTAVEDLAPATPYFAKVPGPTCCPLRERMKCHKPGIYRFIFTNDAWFYTVKITHLLERATRNS
ncbi:unnamed protein product, partial [Mesorhabditis belari]|uniref:CRAL-TRIO domain-containing protein n=1 Tax=Mesorhabditis belari TaxID=2138241 RepID=A0AAF3FAY4_9BILA